MADHDFNFDEFLSETENETNKKATSIPKDTNNTRTTNNTSNTNPSNEAEALHPFSARLDQRYIEIIKALAWWKRISQRALIEEAIELAVNETGRENIEVIVEKFRNRSS